MPRQAAHRFAETSRHHSRRTSRTVRTAGYMWLQWHFRQCFATEVSKGAITWPFQGANDTNSLANSRLWWASFDSLQLHLVKVSRTLRFGTLVWTHAHHNFSVPCLRSIWLSSPFMLCRCVSPDTDVLQLSHCGLRPQQLDKVAAALDAAPWITKLDLSGKHTSLAGNSFPSTCRDRWGDMN